MLFNSIEYLIFLPIVFIIHWYTLSKSFKAQNLTILISSYFFYGWWDWRFLSLISLSIIVDYFIGLKIHDSQDIKVRKSFLWVSICFNLGLLGFFKYCNFFIDSWIDFMASFGYEQKSIWTLNVILPVGISFYTFQTMSYSLDIYYKKIKPTKDFISFATFVSFFPQLVAGPIERATNLLPQFLLRRGFCFDDCMQGLTLILWGMFKKLIIADSLGWRVDYIFDNFAILDGGILILGLIYFSFQIYCDFSGYSDIAIGTAKLFGIDLMPNFKFPYFSRDIGEFWRRWHISLSSWFRDYLYIPLGGSRSGQWVSIRNIFIIFTLSGFWHGAEWKYLMWGLVHALLFCPLFLLGKNRTYTNSIAGNKNIYPSIKEISQITITFLTTTFAWVFFRSDSIYDAFLYLGKLFTNLTLPSNHLGGFKYVLIITILDWLIRKNGRLKPKFTLNKKIYQWIYLLSLIIIIVFGTLSLIFLTNSSERPFIYFQF